MLELNCGGLFFPILEYLFFPAHNYLKCGVNVKMMSYNIGIIFYATTKGKNSNCHQKMTISTKTQF